MIVRWNSKRFIKHLISYYVRLIFEILNNKLPHLRKRLRQLSLRTVPKSLAACSLVFCKIEIEKLILKAGLQIRIALRIKSEVYIQRLRKSIFLQNSPIRYTFTTKESWKYILVGIQKYSDTLFFRYLNNFINLFKIGCVIFSLHRFNALPTHV